MRVTTATDSDGETAIIVGLTQAEFDELKTGDAAWVEGKLLNMPVNVALFAGEDGEKLDRNIREKFTHQPATVSACPSCAAEQGLPYAPMPGDGVPGCSHNPTPN